jgi:hypothetical protein
MQKNCTTMPQVRKIEIALKPLYLLPFEMMHIRLECQPEEFRKLYVTKPAFSRAGLLIFKNLIPLVGNMH